jgi:hypothetical protein
MSQLWRDLADLSSAEDFFAYFDLTFDPKVMAVSRLPILKRFHDNLSRVDGLESLDDPARATSIARNWPTPIGNSPWAPRGPRPRFQVLGEWAADSSPCRMCVASRKQRLRVGPAKVRQP